MKNYLIAALMIVGLALSADISAGGQYKTCPDGTRVPKHDTCPTPPPPPPEDTPDTRPGTVNWWTNVNNNSNHNRNQNSNNNSNHNANNNTNNNSSNSNSNSSSNSSATGGSVGLDNVGNTNIGDVGSTSSASIGDTSLSNNSNSNSSVGDTSSNSGGNTMVGGANTSSNDSSGNSNVSVDSSDRSSTNYESQALVIPTIMTAAPALVANPTLVVDRGVCGPRMDKVQERVKGTYVGIIKRSSIDLGVDDELVASEVPYRYWTSPTGVQHVFGHQVVTYASVNGVAASRSVGLGGGRTGGDWGQAGASSGSSVQRTIMRIQLQECEIQTVARPAYAPPVPVLRGVGKDG